MAEGYVPRCGVNDMYQVQGVICTSKLCLLRYTRQAEASAKKPGPDIARAVSICVYC